MKKFFTLIAAASAALSLAAANFQLYFGDQPVTNGATYTTYPTVKDTEEWEGETFTTWKQNSDIYIHGTVGTEITMEVRANGKVQVCSLDNQCTMFGANGGSVTKTGVLQYAVTDALIDIEGETEGNQKPSEVLKEIKVDITAYETAKPADKVTVTVIMSNQEAAGIGSVEANDEYVKLAAGNTLIYNVNGSAEMHIYAITGNLAAKHHIAGKGALSLSGLSKGIYLYTDGKHKGKFVIK